MQCERNQVGTVLLRQCECVFERKQENRSARYDEQNDCDSRTIHDIVLQHLTELWSNYGDLAEIWFDGGYDVPGLSDKLLNLLEEKQGNAAVFNGCGLTKMQCCGSEVTGHAPHYMERAERVSTERYVTFLWCSQHRSQSNTNKSGGVGDVNGTSYVPKEIDLTLQNSDTWFYQPEEDIALWKRWFHLSRQCWVRFHHSAYNYKHITQSNTQLRWKHVAESCSDA